MNNLALFFQDAGGGGSILWTLLPFVFIFGIFYFLVILPQKKQKQQLQEMIAQLKINDEVVTNGGIIGKNLDGLLAITPIFDAVVEASKNLRGIRD